MENYNNLIRDDIEADVIPFVILKVNASALASKTIVFDSVLR